MGFVPKRKIYNLQFEGAEFDGLVIKAKSVPSGVFLDITARARAAAANPEGSASFNRQLFADFADAVVEWNLSKDDETLWPVGVEALLAQEFQFVSSVIGAWISAIGGVPDPLVESSTGGGPSLEASIPMDVLSSSLPNSPEPT